jgi:hypothetical protein
MQAEKAGRNASVADAGARLLEQILRENRPDKGYRVCRRSPYPTLLFVESNRARAKRR